MNPNNRENELKSKIANLENEIEFLRTHVQLKATDSTLHLNDSNGYVKYLISLAKQNSIYKSIRRFTAWFSKLKVISMILRSIYFITLMLETSALLFIVVILLSFLLPPFILYVFVVFIYSTLRFRRDSKYIFKYAQNKNIIIYFLSRQYPFSSDNFFLRNVLELSSRNYCVIAVSPFALSSSGLSNKRNIFFNFRKEADGVFIIRSLYFFHIKKLIFKNHKKRIIYVY